MSHLTEEELIAWIDSLGWPGGTFVGRGIGDDCAVCRPRPGRELVVSTDLLMEQRHFLAGTTSAFSLGWKTGAANLSDLAAMGAEPAAFFLAAAFPLSRQEYFRGIMQGLHAILSRYHVPLAGGDLSAGPVICLGATVLGEVPAGRSLLRSGGRPGDALFITGQTGLAGAGLRLLAEGWRMTPEGVAQPPAGEPLDEDRFELVGQCLRKHLEPVPRLEAGRFMRESGVVTAAIDTSDGLAKDLRMICQASRCGARLPDLWLQPLQQNPLVRLADVLAGGEDYELLFSVDEKQKLDFRHAWSARPELPNLQEIGRLVAEHPGEVKMETPDGLKPLPVSGYDHFAACGSG